MDELGVRRGRSDRAAPGARDPAMVRRGEARALAGLFVLGAAGCLVTCLYRIRAHEPFGLDLAVGIVAALAAGALALFAPRVGRATLLGLVVAGTAVITAIVALARTEEGTVLTAFAYVWFAIYTASYFSRAVLYGELALLSVGFAVALAVASSPRASIVWVVITGTVWTIGVVLERAVDRLRRQAETDELTGLLNRRGFARAAEPARSLAERVGQPVALVVVDLDAFKAVNDAEGHLAGDRLLVEASTVWRAELRAGDCIGRLGGDEFVLLLPGTTEESTDALLERLRRAHPIAWTAGVAQWGPGEAFEDCLQRADARLYANKRGRHAP